MNPKMGLGLVSMKATRLLLIGGDLFILKHYLETAAVIEVTAPLAGRTA